MEADIDHLSQDWGTLGVPRQAGLARLLHVVETDVATLRHGYYEADAVVPKHRHDRASLVYGVGGPCLELDAAAPVVRRRLTFLPEGHEHALEHLGTTHVLAIEISPDWLRAAGDGRLPSAVIPLPATLYDLVWGALLEIVSQAPAVAVNAALEALVAATLHYVRTPPSPLALALIDELHVHWRDVPSVARLAQKYSLSTQHICRVFRKATGVTLQEYGLMLRLDYARGMLWGSDLPIAEVAAEAGFADQSHLTRSLAAHSAKTPLRLRLAAPCREMPRRNGRSAGTAAPAAAARPALFGYSNPALRGGMSA